MEEAKKIWMDGRMVDWDDATLHVVSNTFQYGFGVFEGIRCYRTGSGPAVFRLDAHMDRMFNSAKIIGMEIPFTKDQLIQAVKETIRANEFEECYIRPIAYIGYGGIGLDYSETKVNTAIAVWYWGEYCGEGKLATGIRVKTSSFTRHHINANMTKAKACGNYLLFQMARTEVRREGYDEALLLDPEGYVAEGSVENIFIIRQGEITTPPLTYILEGVTRDAIIKLAREEGFNVREEFFSRDFLYIADEVFFCGTGAEVTPVVEVDCRKIGSGAPGAVTKKIQKIFFDTVQGKNEKHMDWLTFVD